MPHYDHIPAGKKEVFDKESGEWILVDLKDSDVDDLRIIIEEKDARIKELESEIAGLRLQEKKHSGPKK